MADKKKYTRTNTNVKTKSKRLIPVKTKDGSIKLVLKKFWRNH